MKFFLIVFTAVLTSFGFFPFSFVWLPEMNTKNIMAGVGLVLLLLQLSKERSSAVNRDFLSLLVYGGIVSLIGFVSTVYNDTSDYTYSTYIISMLIWLSSSYVIVSAIRCTHGYASIELVINYLTVVCVGQCVLALSMDLYAPLKNAVDSVMYDFLGKTEERLYGLGAAIDIAGTRFSAVLIMIAYICTNKVKLFSKNKLTLYLIAFFIISIIGNMIARTTIIGTCISILYYFFASGHFRFRENKKRTGKYFIGLMVIAILVSTYLYHTNHSIRANIRFAFEGFFSLVEKGYWEVSSNNRLATMVRFPDNLKTWIIGDGYFNNPLEMDNYYIGHGIGEYYMNTDIGYLRFIYYFGLVGTAMFCLYFLKAADICIKRFNEYRAMFVLIIILNYIIWCKVSTDIFLVFALFLTVSQEEYKNEETKNIIEEKLPVV